MATLNDYAPAGGKKKKPEPKKRKPINLTLEDHADVVALSLNEKGDKVRSLPQVIRGLLDFYNAHKDG